MILLDNESESQHRSLDDANADVSGCSEKNCPVGTAMLQGLGISRKAGRGTLEEGME